MHCLVFSMDNRLQKLNRDGAILGSRVVKVDPHVFVLFLACPWQFLRVCVSIFEMLFMLPGYMLPMIMPPGAAPFLVQVNSLPMPPTMTAGPIAVPRGPMANSCSSTLAMHQANSAPTTGGVFDNST